MRRCRFSVAAASPARRPSSACTAKYARCVSMKAPRKCSSLSSRAASSRRSRRRRSRMTKANEASSLAAGVAANAFRTSLPVRFSHCDPAGIVFYPRYLEMFNDVVEEWLREGLGFSLTEIVTRRGWGVPTVRLEVDFTAPSYFGETLAAFLVVRKLGTSSMGIEITLRGPDGVDDRKSTRLNSSHQKI